MTSYLPVATLFLLRLYASNLWLSHYWNFFRKYKLLTITTFLVIMNLQMIILLYLPVLTLFLICKYVSCNCSFISQNLILYSISQCDFISCNCTLMCDFISNNVNIFFKLLFLMWFHLIKYLWIIWSGNVIMPLEWRTCFPSHAYFPNAQAFI